MLVLIAVTLVILLVAATFAIDFAHIHVTRAELRTATDAASRAASEVLGRTGDESLARQVAIDIAQQNNVAGQPLQLRPSEIEFGANQRTGTGRFQFLPGKTPINTVRVLGDRSQGSLSGSVPMLFGQIFGVTEFNPRMVATSTQQLRDIALVLDVSGSMQLFGRFDALRNALTVFLQELEDLPQLEMVSLTVYSTNARKLQDMTSDLNAIQRAFANESPAGWTAIGEGIELGLRSFQDPRARSGALKQIIVMTDGNHNRGVSPLIKADEAAQQGITIHTITFSRDANVSLMRQVADRTGGIHLHADTNELLIEAFRDVARELPVLLIE